MTTVRPPLTNTSRKRTIGHVPSYIQTIFLTPHKQSPLLIKRQLFLVPRVGLTVTMIFGTAMAARKFGE